MHEIIFINDNIESIFDNEEKNVNDIIKDFWLVGDSQLKMQFTTFCEYYDKLMKETKLNSQSCCDIALGLANLKKPNIKFNLNNDMKDIENEYISFIKSKKIKYQFKGFKELIPIILYYNIPRNYKLKFCSICNNYFLTKNAKIKYCSDECLNKNKSIKEMDRRKNDPVAYMKNKINDMMCSRNDVDSYNLFEEYKNELQIKELELNKDDLFKWLEEKHKFLKRR